MVVYNVDYTVGKVSSELVGFEGANLAEGAKAGWLAQAEFGMASVDINFGTAFSIASVTLVATRCAGVEIVLKGHKGERNSWMGGGGALRGAGAAQGGVSVYKSSLPPSEGVKKYLPCRNSGDCLRAVVEY